MNLRESIAVRPPSRGTFATAAKKAIAIALMVVLGATVIGVTMIAASPPPSPSKAATASASLTPAASVTSNPTQGEIASQSHLPDGPAVIGFLSQVIGWYRHLPLEERLVSDPADLLFVADDRQMADEVLDLSFEFAKAHAALLAATAGGAPDDGKHRVAAGTEDVAANAAKSDVEIKAAQDRLKNLQNQLANAGGRQRRNLVPQLMDQPGLHTRKHVRALVA
jgi:hypothetical protein